MKRALFSFLVIVEILFMLVLATIVLAMEVKSGEKVLLPREISISPIIDGNLEDEAWQNDTPLIKDFITYNPLYGEVFPQKTLIWMAYDSDNLYFAFYCYDSEPQKIKTSITKRDNMWNDDWVGISLDSLGNKQSSYDLFVNPNGIQGDILNSVVSGEDSSLDFVWYSAGRVTDDGYQVEMRIPLRSILFKGGKEVRMGILFKRKISRLGICGCWPDLKPGYGMFNILATAIYKSLRIPLNFELLPNFVYGKNDNRKDPHTWNRAETFSNIGIDLKYGITSSITAEVTVNPDFSQVESDAFQVEVNQRYPLFYSEKRPFFMEGLDIFDFAVDPWGFMLSAVHTRNIAEPNWGAKFSGTSGRITFGILTSADKRASTFCNEELISSECNTAYITIARSRYSLGGENYIGALYSGREFTNGYNRVIGSDFICRFRDHHQTRISFLQTYSQETEDGKKTNGSGINFVYSYDIKPLGFWVGYARYGTDFRMDSAFYKRIGISNGWIWIGPKFYPDPQKVSWLKLIHPQFTAQITHDFLTNMNDKLLNFAIQLSFTKQGFVDLAYYLERECWANKAFSKSYLELEARVQITKWLHLGSNLSSGDRIYYDLENPYLGKANSFAIKFIFQPRLKINQYFEFNYTDFYSPLNNQRAYEVSIINSHTTYQFNKYFFVRAILQYNSYQHKLLTDFLASCTIIPGTVLHIGYGALFEKRDWQNNRWINNGLGNMLNMKRSFFFKASYLWRF
jgi:hypothetical protein